jgi:hypothetical protein
MEKFYIVDRMAGRENRDLTTKGGTLASSLTPQCRLVAVNVRMAIRKLGLHVVALDSSSLVAAFTELFGRDACEDFQNFRPRPNPVREWPLVATTPSPRLSYRP